MNYIWLASPDNGEIVEMEMWRFDNGRRTLANEGIRDLFEILVGELGYSIHAFEQTAVEQSRKVCGR